MRVRRPYRVARSASRPVASTSIFARTLNRPFSPLTVRVTPPASNSVPSTVAGWNTVTPRFVACSSSTVSNSARGTW